MKGMMMGITFAEYPYERREMQFIVKHLKDPKVIIDVGANIGWYSVCLAKTYPKAYIYAFEPMPKIYRKLELNLLLNDIRNVGTYRHALSNKFEEPEFYYHPDYPAASSIKEDKRWCSNKVRSVAWPLDNLAMTNIDFIKIDVEGNELNVLKGAMKKIKKYKPMIMCELSRKWCKKFDYHPNDIIKFLKDFDYKCYDVYDRQVKEITDDTLDRNFFFI